MVEREVEIKERQIAMLCIQSQGENHIWNENCQPVLKIECMTKSKQWHVVLEDLFALYHY